MDENVLIRIGLQVVLCKNGSENSVGVVAVRQLLDTHTSIMNMQDVDHVM